MQECVFEDYALKRSVFEEAEKHVRDDVVMASSTGNVFASRLSDGLRLKDRLVVAHPVCIGQFIRSLNIYISICIQFSVINMYTRLFRLY